MVLSAQWPKFVVIIVLCWTFFADPACAKGNFSQGMDFFASGNYQEAAEIFQQCINESADDKEAYYFAAKAQEKIGNLAKARSLYAEIVEKFPNTSYASDAIVQIGHLDTAKYSGSRASHLPIAFPTDATVVNYEITGKNLTIPVTINGKSWRMILDNGGNHSMIGKNHLRQLGITPPNWETNAYVVTPMGKNPVWKFPLDLTVSGELWRHFRFYVTENMPTLYPSLGQSFLRRHNYFVDAQDRKIYFVKRSSDRAFEEQLGAIAYKQPFQSTLDDRIIVNVLVNGIPCEMQLDIGA